MPDSDELPHLHMTYVCSSVPEVLWATSTSTQAIARNMRVPYYMLLYTAAGAGHQDVFLGSACMPAHAHSILRRHGKKGAFHE